MSTRKSNCLVYILIMTFLLLAGATIIFILLSFVPQQANFYFGNPDPGLSIIDKDIYAIKMLINKQALSSPIYAESLESPFAVEPGESVNSISLRLEQSGYISNANIFRDYMVYSGLDRLIQAGTYIFQKGMTAIEIAQAMKDSTPKEITFNILAGLRAEEIAALLPTSGLSITPEDLLYYVQNPNLISMPSGFTEITSLEGYLFPGSYILPRTLDAKGLIENLIDGFQQNLTTEIQNGINEQGLTIHQAVVLASLVEKEAIHPDEMPLIASVFYNRLSDGMKLDSDPTVQYVLGFDATSNSWWKNPLNLADLQTNSPYNTYLYPGLPPTAICNPGKDALNSVAFPAKSNYYFFRAKCDSSGYHAFSETFEEHLQNACP